MGEEGRVQSTLAWEFYEKPSASSRVLRATSGFCWRLKLVSMSMEVFRRQRNTSRQVNLARRVEIITDFVTKLRRSGYAMGTVGKIVEDGCRFYYRTTKV